MNWRVQVILVIGTLFLAGCGTTSGVDMTLTVSANEAMMAQEIAMLNSDSFARRTEVSMTLAVKETELAQILDLNQVIGATLAVGSTPTYDLQLGIAQPDRDVEKYQEFMTGRNVNPPMPGGNSAFATPVMSDDMNAIENRGGMTDFALNTGQIARLGVASAVDPNTDCPVDIGTNFSTGVSALYLVMRANGLPAGAPLAVTWYYGEEIRAQDTWATPRDFNGVCIWFILEDNRTEFTAGEWSVQLFAYNQPIEDRLRFTLTN
ncbi:MAG TPA: hypothetical protein PLZ51_08805 [Aggregatilineales bacterium]|nr:hypothetical protein [Aggregatilineales bacterium]